MGTSREPSVDVASGDPLSTSTGGIQNDFIFVYLNISLYI
jgi:hypothetical protein